MFRVFTISVVTFVICAVATYAVAMSGVIGLWNVLGVVDRDGGGSMAVAFVIAPALAFIGGSLGAVAAGLYALRRRASVRATSEDRRRDVSRFARMTGALAGGLAGHLLAEFAFWLAAPIRYDAIWKAYAHAWAPTLATLVGAIVGGLLAARSFRS